MKFLALLSFFSLGICCRTLPSAPRCAVVSVSATLVGDAISSFANAKMLALCYKLPFYYSSFGHYSCFMLSRLEKNAGEIQNYGDYLKIHVCDERLVPENIGKDKVVFLGSIITPVVNVEPAWIAELKKDLQPVKIPTVNVLPSDRITVAVHVRKGNGGGEHYDGTLSSVQQFDFDRSQVSYIPASLRFNYAFDWETFIRDMNGKLVSSSFARGDITRLTYPVENMDSLYGWETKFPPEQYYIDQVIKLSACLRGVPLFVQIFTDDKDPLALVARFRSAVTNVNAIIHYEDNRKKDHEQRIIEDLYNMSRFQVFIRSQSYFARVAELMGDHAVIFYPLNYAWQGKKLIMNKIIVKINGPVFANLLNQK